MKLEVNGMSMVFPDGMSEEDRNKEIVKRLNNLYFTKDLSLLEKATEKNINY